VSHFLHATAALMVASAVVTVVFTLVVRLRFRRGKSLQER
jgi:hypothetical protein